LEGKTIRRSPTKKAEKEEMSYDNGKIFSPCRKKSRGKGKEGEKKRLQRIPDYTRKNTLSANLTQANVLAGRQRKVNRPMVCTHGSDKIQKVNLRKPNCRNSLDRHDGKTDYNYSHSPEREGQ